MVAALILALLLIAHPSEGLEVYGYAKDATGGEGHPRIDIAPTESQLRTAMSFCNANGGAQVHFSQAGTITLLDNLNWNCSNATIDGSDAPNGGVQLTGDEFRIDGAHNVIIRHLRFRGNTVTNQSPLEIDNGTLLVFDHISCQWATDGCPNMGDGSGAIVNVTFQFGLFAEPADPTWDPVGSSAGVLVSRGVTNVTFYRNVFFSSTNRNPQISPLEPHQGITETYVNLIENFFGNFHYGARIQPGEAGETTPENVVTDVTFRGNIWQRSRIAFPSGSKFPIHLKTGYQGRAYLYVDQSQMLSGPTGDMWGGVTEGSVGQYDPAATEVANTAGSWPTTALASCDTVAEAPCAIRRGEPNTMLGSQSTATKDSILATAGATLPCRDPLDTHIIESAQKGTFQNIPLSGPSLSMPDLTLGCR